MSDATDVQAIARDYIEGWYTGDVRRMERALHDDLVKRIPSADAAELREVTKARMVELTTSGGAGSPYAAFEIIVDDISTDIATVRVLSVEYLDYLHIAKTADGWRIVNVLFHVLD